MQPASTSGGSGAIGHGACFNQEPRNWLRSARPWDRLAYITRRLPAAIEQASRELEIAPGMRVLDFGCADKPYRGLFSAELDYVGADIPGNPRADLTLGPDGTLPAPDASFDAVLSTQVLEHVQDPPLYMRECARVLRPGGRLLLSTHGIMVLHPDPVDYWRWTSDGLSYEVERSGLRVISFVGVMGLAATAVQLFQDATLGQLPKALQSPYALLLQSLIALCDRLQSERSRRYNALVYLVVAEKPAPVGGGQ